MGLDLSALAVRLDSFPMRTIREDAEAWNIAIEHAPFCHLPSHPLPEISRQLLASLPDGPHWTLFFLDRSYEQAEFLLDPTGYRSVTSWEQRERTLPFRIIQGDRYFADHARATQGIPWRCSTAGFLARAADMIDSIDPAAARREFSVVELAAHGAYKVDETADDDETFGCVLDNLRQLARHYRGLADRGLDLLIVRD